MGEHSFDELARGLASGTVSRRKALRLMGAALVGGTLASLGIGEAAADLCKRNGKACKKDKQCCSGNCEGGTCAACTVNTDCSSGRCASDVCAEPCPSDRVLLSNGTCAAACVTNDDCAGCGGCLEAASGAFYCRDSFGPRGECQSDDDCPTGQFCESPGGAPSSSCIGVC